MACRQSTCHIQTGLTASAHSPPLAWGLSCFNPSKPNDGKGTADLFLHITSNCKFTGYDILPDYGVFDIFKNPDIPRALEDYKRHLEKHCL